MQSFIKVYGHYNSTTDSYVLSSSIQSLTTSIINVGELLGAISSYLVDDRIGRRGGLFVSSAFVTAGVIFQVSADELGLLIVGRLLMGFAVGLISCLVPLYIADCSPSRFRGALVSVYQFDIGIGLILGVVVDYATKNRNDSGAYRIPMAVQLIFPLILVPGLILFAPESPRWLLSKGRPEKARAALRQLYGDNLDLIETEMTYISSMIEEEQRNDGSWTDLFKWKVDGRQAYLGSSIQAWQQSSGINFITSYGIVFFSAIGMSNTFLIQMGLYLAPMPALWFSQYCIERFGRRPMLLTSTFLVCIILFIVGGAGTVSEKSIALDQLIVGMVYIFMIAYNLSLGPAVWVVTSESSTGPNRSKLMATSTATNWFFSWVVTFTFPYLFNSDGADLGAQVGFIYGGLMFAATIWIYFFLPETSGRTLEDIQVMFENQVPAREFKSYLLPHQSDLPAVDDEKKANATRVEVV